MTSRGPFQPQPFGDSVILTVSSRAKLQRLYSHRCWCLRGMVALTACLDHRAPVMVPWLFNNLLLELQPWQESFVMAIDVAGISRAAQIKRASPGLDAGRTLRNVPLGLCVSVQPVIFCSFLIFVT